MGVTAVFYAVVTALLVLGQGVSGVGGEDEIAAEHSFMHNVNLTEHKRGKSLRRLPSAPSHHPKQKDLFSQTRNKMIWTPISRKSNRKRQ